LVGRRVGVEFESVEILAFAHRTVIRLRPAPVVVKIALASDYPSLERELAVARRVAAAGGPAAPPLHGGAAGPHREGEYTATLWQYLSPINPPSDLEEAGVRSYCQLRQVLDSYPGDLPTTPRRSLTAHAR
jgi:hypothetical protein